MKTIIKDLKAIIKIQEQIIKANAASARTYKAELKVTVKLYGKAMDNWLSAMDMAGKVKNKITVFPKSPSTQDLKKNKKRHKKSK